jgi:hypothetical protein
MKLTPAAILGAVLLLPAAAMAQTAMVSTNTESNGFVTNATRTTSRIGGDFDPSSARDGCVNVPGKAHNSADCGTIYWMDPNTVLPDKPAYQLTGAEENLLRNARILWGRGANTASGAPAAPAPGAPAVAQALK